MINLARRLWPGIHREHHVSLRAILYQAHACSYSILGIETSCDDTGSAIINEKGELLAESLKSQNHIHVRNGGIIPDIAQELHRNCIEQTVKETLDLCGKKLEDITAIAVTLRPGLALSLAVGMKYAKYLARQYKKPIIPIHHMEAHALAVRMHNNIQFPFLVLLISGGHCLLAVAQDVNKFLLLGESIDIAPGEAFDKVSRRMKLRNIPEYSQMSGGQAIEAAALKSKNSDMFKLPLPLADHKDCNFSFNGLKTSVLLHLHRRELQHNITADKLIPEVNDLCAAMLKATTRHLVHRTQRAIDFCIKYNYLPQDNMTLVLSGGVACNNYIYNCFKLLSHELDYKIFRPLPRLCTDNGVMIAWNGLEKFRSGIDIVTDINSLDIEASSPLGDNLISEVKNANIVTKLIKIKLNT